MRSVRAIEVTQPRTTDEVVRGARHRPRLQAVFAGLTVALSLALAAAPTTRADTTICSPGTGAGQCESPQGIATDFENGRLYVADQGNNRIDAFEANGSFALAFGWGVRNGSAAFQTCGPAATPPTASCQAGIAGTGVGQFDHPSWVAVDNNEGSTSRHDLYVGSDNFHIQKFEPNGSFLKAFGDKGTGECEIARTLDPIAIGPGGNVYIADAFETAPGKFKNRIERFDPEGSCLGEVVLFEDTGSFVREFGVDAAGNSYVTVEGGGGKLRKYGPSGALLYEVGVSDSEFDKDAPGKLAAEAEGVAIDSGGNVFTRQRGQQLTKPAYTNVFTEYDPSGNIVRRFGYLNAQVSVVGLAAYHGAAGDLFASGGQLSLKYLSFPPPGPVIFPEPCRAKALGNTKATLLAEVNPEGKATTVHAEYVDQGSFEEEGGFASPNTKTTPESEAIGPD